ncbi:hypothetical protein DSO57_1030958 [Entomophthora muscae]|uniref:Uncharacterized protein n=1 Tax=Entomophthora muscae TaxID=34485 RepID=A0ACC2UAT8_9FUNG|nr:hypothetical protein DSO57_1030958 [Entomophthora muscae]
MWHMFYFELKFNQSFTKKCATALLSGFVFGEATINQIIFKSNACREACMERLSHFASIVLCVLSVAVVVAFGAFAGVLIVLHRKKSPEGETFEFFLTARNTQPMLRVMWSFVAGLMGSWIVTMPADNASRSGIIGVISYAVFCGLPIYLLALVGEKVQKVMPRVLSFGDYVRYRFGVVPQLYVAVIAVFNLGVALTVEYSSVNSIFTSILGRGNFPIAPIIFVVTTAYTAFGGLLVSIITDVYQGIVGTGLVCVLVATVALSFRPELGPLPEHLGATENGYTSIFILPVTLMAATVFTEAPWQRVWASESPAALRRGALFASLILSLVVFVLGLLGYFAAWSGLKTEDPNVLLIMMVASKHQGWIAVLIAVMTAIICESAIDTLQNALASAISTMVLRDRPLIWVRILVLLLNIPPVYISYQNHSAFDLFTAGNKVACTAFIPLLLGLYQPAMPYLTGPCMLFASLLSFLSMVGFGMIYMGDFTSGLDFILYDPYDPYSVLVAIVSSVACIAIWVGLVGGLQKLGAPKFEIPGFHPYYNDGEKVQQPLHIELESEKSSSIA